MSDAPHCCVNCAVHKEDVAALKKALEFHGLSDSQIWAIGHDLLRKAIVMEPSKVTEFLYEPADGASVESQSATGPSLTWEGVPYDGLIGKSSALGKPSGSVIISSLLLPHSRTKRASRDYLAPLRIAARLNSSEITEVLLDYIYRNKTLPDFDVSMRNLETIRLLVRTDNLKPRLDESKRFDPVILLAETEILIKVLLNPCYFNKPPLHHAAESNNVDTIKAQLQQHAYVDTSSHAELTPLHVTARLGHTESAEILLDHGADTNRLCSSALEILLHAAVKENNEHLVDLLLRDQNSVNANIQNRVSLIQMAADHGNLNVVKLLMSNDADVDAPYKETNVLCRAVEKRNLQLIERMIVARSDTESSMDETQSKIFDDLRQLGFGVDLEDAKGCSLLHDAVNGGYLKIVEYLLNLGTKINIECKTENNATPLIAAVKYKHIEIAVLLIKNKACVNVKDNDGKTPLHYAIENVLKSNEIKRPLCICRQDVSKMIRYVEDRLVQVNERINGTTAEHKFINFLLERKAKVNSTDAEMETSLHSAARNGDGRIIKILVDKGARVNAKRIDGAAALHIALKRQKRTALNIVKVLLDEGADIDAKQNNGVTALHIATEQRNVEMLRLLLDYDADINVLRNDGKTLLDYAISGDLSGLGDFTEVIIILGQHIAKLLALNRWVCDRNIQATNRFDDYKRLHDQCKREIETMKLRTIKATRVSYYDILTKGMSQLTLYASNKDIAHAMGTGCHKNMFSLYSTMICHRFRVGQKRACLLDASMKSFRLLSGYPVSDLSIIEIFEYLRNEDLENLIMACSHDESDN